MRLIRVRDRGRTLLVRAEAEGMIVLAEESSHPAADVLRESLAGGVDLAGPGELIDPIAVDVLAPLANPSKVVCVGLNYPQHVEEADEHRPVAPVIFGKFPSSIIGPGQPIFWPDGSTAEVDYEAEVGVVISRLTKAVSTDDALQHVLGLVPCNDVSARDVQFNDGQWTRGKSFDTFLPLGPSIVTLEDLPEDLDVGLHCVLNGEIVQDGRVSEMIFPIAYLVSYISRFISLQAGDLVLTGTPSGVGFARTPPVFLEDGDTVRVSVEGVGSLVNPVRLG